MPQHVMQEVPATALGSLTMLARQIHSIIALELASIGLVSGEDEALAAIAAGTISLGDFAGRLAIRHSTARRILDSLAAKKLVSRTNEAAGTKAEMVALTPAGADALETVRAIWERTDRQVVAAIPAQERAGFIERVEAIQGNFSGEIVKIG